MWTCTSCGMPVADDAEACPACGAPRSVDPVATRVFTPPVPGGHTAQNPEQRTLATTPSREDDEACDSMLVLRPSWTRAEGEIRIDVPFCVLGREGDYRAELFSPRVSRQQVELSYMDGTWTATQLGTTNLSWVWSKETGSRPLNPGESGTLHDGDRLRLADQTFFVRIEQVEHVAPAADDDSAAPVQDLVEGWFVTCPRCGTIFRRSGQDDRQREGCTVCTDSGDKREIRKVIPRHDALPVGAFIDVR